MNKSLRLFLVLSLIAAMCLGFIACGSSNSPHGTYRDNHGIFEFTFSGNKVSYISLHRDSSNSGTFTMDGTTVNISYPNGNRDSFEYDPKNDTLDWMGLGDLIFTKVK